MANNRLGRVLRYMTDAWRYAVDSGDAVKAGGQRMFADVITEMGRLGAYGAGDVVDTEAAYTLAVTAYAVYSAIKLVADRTADRRAGFEVKQRVGPDLEDLGNHGFERLLARPNTLMSGSFLKRYTTWWYWLRGNAYVFIASPAPGVGEPSELWPLVADQVTPRPDLMHQGRGVFRGQLVIDYEYQINGRIEFLPGENVVHFRTPNPFDYWVGLSPLTAALTPVQTDAAQARWVRDFFATKNAVPAAIMSVPAETGDEEFNEIRRTLREQFEKGQRTLITRAGDLSVAVIQQTIEQMQVMAGREFNAKAVDRIFGIPEGLVTGGLSGDSRLAAEIALARNTVQPLLDYFAEEWSANIGPFYGADVVIEAPNIVPQDRALEAEEYRIYSLDRTINENRATRGLTPSTHNWAEVPVRLLTIEGAVGSQAGPALEGVAGQAAPTQVVAQAAGRAVDLAELDGMTVAAQAAMLKAAARVLERGELAKGGELGDDQLPAALAATYPMPALAGVVWPVNGHDNGREHDDGDDLG